MKIDASMPGQILGQHKWWWTRNFKDIMVHNVNYMYTWQNVRQTSGLPMNGMWSHLHMPTHASSYLGVLLPHVQNLIWQVNHTSSCQQMCHLPICKQFICNFMLSKVLICRNPLHYLIFRSTHIDVRDAQKHFKRV